VIIIYDVMKKEKIIKDSHILELREKAFKKPNKALIYNTILSIY